MPRYHPKSIEPKWQEYWLRQKTFKAQMRIGQPKFYCLDMFPYPSSNGLHVGHPEGYTATDIVCRYKRMRGFNVLHPMGWDAFGLPAEQHAIKTGTHPAETTQRNIDNFRKQIRALGFSYDWDREISTCDPAYFKWTQWIFKQLFESFYDTTEQKARPIADLPVPDDIRRQGAAAARRFRDERRLAYIAEAPVWWCQELGTVLANEEVIDGKSERGRHACERRPMRQWVLRITAYAERLLNDLEGLDWPDAIKSMQRNWIGRSEGALVKFKIAGRGPSSSTSGLNIESISVFTTRPDTLFGATFMVVAPEHPLVEALTTPEQREAVAAYRKQAGVKSDLERGLDREKTGVFTGGYAVNPVNGSRLPVWTADYVMMGYGTGAIMAVPAHDERDYAFAHAMRLPIIEVISGGDVAQAAYVGAGPLVHSEFLNGLDVTTAKQRIIEWLEAKGSGQARVQYKLRDWLFSRQRYWGEPFPIVHGPDGPESVPDAELPVTLPALEDYQPTGTFDPPLSKAKGWVEYAADKKRELNTMPQWAGSSWYFLRFLDPHNEQAAFSAAAEKYWMPVDLYIGGAEHAVLHLLYARFWHKVLSDLGHVSAPEPFHKLVNQGLILGEDGEKMSKSRGNVVNPDEVIESHGADSMRLYEMFMGPLERVKPWQTAGIEGLWRFLNRAWRVVAGDEKEKTVIGEDAPPEDLLRAAHRCIKKVTEDLEGLRFNTAISALMVFTGELSTALERDGVAYRSASEILVKLLSPFAPHIAEELWQILGHAQTVAYEPWPDWDAAWVAENEVEVVYQTNGKVRVREMLPKGLISADLEARARGHEKFAAQLANQDVIKVIVVPDKLVNFVVKPKS